MTGTAPFARSTPEAQGIRSSAIQAFVEAVDREIRDLHSFVLLRHGTLVAEAAWDPCRVDAPHMLFSLSKSFTSTAVGMLIAEGRLSLDDSVLAFFPEDAPGAPSDNLRAMRVRHLLTMTTGHDADPTPLVRQAGQPWTRVFLTQPIDHPPGTHFVYNSVATYMLSAIVQKITGQRLIEYLQPRLFVPLGFAQPTWETSPEGIDAGGWGLRLTTLEIARFGQLYLQKGIWQGNRLIPESWVAEATARQVPNGPSANPDWEQGYGYQFWRCRHGAYRGDGAFGQFCVVMPSQEAVVAVTSGTRNLQAVLDLVWAHLLPALGSGDEPDNRSAQTALTDRLAALRLRPASGTAGSPRAAALSGREFSLDDNPDHLTSLRFDFAAAATTLTVRTARGDQQVPCGYQRWAKSEGTLLHARPAARGDATPVKIAASGAWSDDATYVVDVCWYETPFRRTFTCHFDGDQLRIAQSATVGFGDAELPRIEGRAIPGEVSRSNS